jgi:hypothetical protein
MAGGALDGPSVATARNRHSILRLARRQHVSHNY